MSANSTIYGVGMSLILSSAQHDRLRDILFSCDGKEKVAVGLCGRLDYPAARKLLLYELHPVPAEAYISRSQDHVSWRTEWMVPLLAKATKNGLSILKFHSHPGGYDRFSERDDASDAQLFRSIHGWLDQDHWHGSVIMLPSGRMFGRLVESDGSFTVLQKVMVVGDDIVVWDDDEQPRTLPEFTKRHAQLFGSATTTMLRGMSAAVVGCSGTGSIVIELLARLGIGRLVLIDPDRVEEKNLNRILNAGRADAEQSRYKVDVLADAIRDMGLGTCVETHMDNICDAPQTVKAAASADVLFGCTDKHESRLLLNKLATFYLMPYFDLGVRADADGAGNVSYVGGMVHYVQPGKSSLLSRGTIDLNIANAEYMKRQHPEQYERQLEEKYLRGVKEDSPAVISLNAQAASLAVNEFLARIHPFRSDANAEYARTAFDLTNGLLIKSSEEDFDACVALGKYAGRGDKHPLLDTPTLSGASDA